MGPRKGAFPCELCTRTFTRKYHLQRHAVSHDSSRPFTCPLCLSSFNRRDVLNRHVEAHARREQLEASLDANRHTKLSTESNENCNSSMRGHDRTMPTRHTRTTAACDACAVLKVKCDDQAPCRACEQVGIRCTFIREQRLKGRYRDQAEPDSGNSTHTAFIVP
jgi:uncharacterized Zn-finger protein